MSRVRVAIAVRASVNGFAVVIEQRFDLAQRAATGEAIEVWMFREGRLVGAAIDADEVADQHGLRNAVRWIVRNVLALEPGFNLTRHRAAVARTSVAVVALLARETLAVAADCRADPVRTVRLEQAMIAVVERS